MATTTITTELLDALLSPDAQRRGEAEAYFQGIAPVERVGGLVPMIQPTPTATNNESNATGRVSLGAVLLRRDILRLTADALPLLESILSPLLEAFLQPQGSALTRTAIGHCLAEICGTVAMVSPSPKDQEQVMARILQAVSVAVVQGDIPSLRLLAAMAERAPNVFASTAVPSLPSLTQQVCTTCLTTSNNQNNATTILEALMQVLVQAAIATQQQSSTAVAASAILSFASKPIDTVDPNSPAAALGRSCLPVLMEHVSTMLSSTTTSSSNSILAILQHWTNAATHCPSLLAGTTEVLEAVFNACLMVSNNSSNIDHDEDTTTALAALEVLSSLCAVGDVKRKILAVDPTLCQILMQGNPQRQQLGVIALTAQLIINGVDDDVEGWTKEPASLLEGDQWESDDAAIYAESLFQSFLHSLAAPALSVALPLVESLLQNNSDWRQQRAGLAMMEACLTSAPVAFTPFVPVAMEAALSLATAAQPIRLQWQALRLLGVLCETDVTLEQSNDETVRQHYSLRVLQGLSQAVQSPTSKVSALACLAIVSYCRGGAATGKSSSDDDLHPVTQFLSDLLQALVAGPLSLDVVDRGAVVVKIRAIGAVACLAEAGGEAFAPFYASIMPGLLTCSQMQHRGNHEMTQLIGAAIESATIIGQATEADETTRARYVTDAQQIMQFIVPILQQAEMGNSDMPLDQLLSSCARIASVMGPEYAPYVNMVLPHLLKRASAPPDVSVTDGNEAGLDATKRDGLEIDEDLGTESMTLAVPGKGMQRFTVNTSKIQEKAQAARAVYEHASALGSDFAPYVEPCLNAFVPLISFQFSPEVRSTSAQAVASVFEAACSAADESKFDIAKLQQCFPMLVKTITKQIHSEEVAEMDALYALADALSEIFYSVFQRLDTFGRAVASSLSLTDANDTVGMTMGSISSCLQRRGGIYRILSGRDGALTGEDEKQECEAQLKEEEKLLTPLVDSVGYTLKFLREQFVPLFEKTVAPALGPSLTNGDIRARLCAVCLFDDCVEFCGSAAAAKFAEKLVYGILLGIDDASNNGDLELKSASIYGVSQICRNAPAAVLAPHLESIVHHLLLVVKSTTKDASDSPMMYENAISALASLALIGGAPFASTGSINREEVLSIFVENLPIREDGDEAKICHAGFCNLVEQGSVNLTSEATKVLQVVGEVLFFVSDGETIASPETCSRLANIVVQMQQQLPGDRMNEAFATISVEAQNGINQAMQ